MPRIVQELTYRARINNVKQKYKLKLDYVDAVYGPSQAHGVSHFYPSIFKANSFTLVWCGTWTLNNNHVISTGESRTKDGAKEDSAKQALEILISLGFRE